MRFLNRVAAAVGALVTLGVPIWLVLSFNAAQPAAVKANLEACLRGRSPEGYAANYSPEYCRATFSGPPNYLMGWSEWLEAVLIFAALSALVYALVWLIVRAIMVVRRRSATRN